METLQKIKPDGELKLPPEVMKKLKLRIGEKVRLRVRDHELLIKSAKSKVDEITGAIELDQKTAEKIINSKELTMSMWD